MIHSEDEIYLAVHNVLVLKSGLVVQRIAHTSFDFREDPEGDSGKIRTDDTGQILDVTRGVHYQSITSSDVPLFGISLPLGSEDEVYTKVMEEMYGIITYGGIYG